MKPLQSDLLAKASETPRTHEYFTYVFNAENPYTARAFCEGLERELIKAKKDLEAMRD